MVERGFVPPVFLSFIQQLYKTGTLKVDCVVLRFEHFDTATVKEVRSVEKPPTIINVPSSHNSEWILCLDWINVVTIVPKVVNVLATSNIRNGLKVQARNQG